MARLEELIVIHLGKELQASTTLRSIAVFIKFRFWTEFCDRSVKFTSLHSIDLCQVSILILFSHLLTHFLLMPRSRMMELYLHSMMRLHGVVLN
jgi:hypothetical protein